MPDPESLDALEDAVRLTVSLPSLGADMDVGRVIEWRVAIGDAVERGDIVAVVSTEKSDIDVESWDSGEVTELVAPMNEEIPVGAPLLVLESRTASAPTPLEAPTGSPKTTTQTQRQPVSPFARRIAAESGISLVGIEGSGPNGEILEGNAVEPEVYVPLTRENFRTYHRDLLAAALRRLTGTISD